MIGFAATSLQKKNAAGLSLVPARSWSCDGIRASFSSCVNKQEGGFIHQDVLEQF